jgi:hypothetical protein
LVILVSQQPVDGKIPFRHRKFGLSANAVAAVGIRNSLATTPSAL